MMIRTRKATLASLALASLIAIVGCGKPSTPTGSLQGKVLLDGAPLADATVMFVSKQTGAAASAPLQSDGTFKVPAPVRVGTYTVFLGPKGEAAESDQPTPEVFDKSIPDKYRTESTSDATIEVKEGENDVTVELKK